MERHNDCRSAGSDKEREKPEMDTQQSFVVALANSGSNPRVRLSPPFPPVPPFSCVCGFNRSFQAQKFKQVGMYLRGADLKRRGPANAKKKLKQSSSKRPGSERGDCFKAQSSENTQR